VKKQRNKKPSRTTPKNRGPGSRVAVFDIDGTIFRSSLLIEVTNALIANKIFPKGVEEIYKKAKTNWLNRRADYDQYIWDVIRAFDKNIKGVHYKKFKRVAKEVVDAQEDKVYRYTRDLVKELKRRKYFLLAISHSPKDIVDEFAKRLGFDKVYGRLIAMNTDGTFTGKTLLSDLIFNKAKVVERAVLKEDLTLRGSVGVGDTESDIPLLKMVARPICFNPNKKLYSYAKRRGWKIVVERKNVIYKL
jgi:HAD superfamily hydrolase (TIGR01490 family)